MLWWPPATVVLLTPASVRRDRVVAVDAAGVRRVPRTLDMAALPDVLDASGAAAAGEDIMTAELFHDMLKKTVRSNDVFVFFVLCFRARATCTACRCFP